MNNEERVITFKATLIATFVFWSLVTMVFGLMLLPAVLDINIKYTKIIDLDEARLERIEIAEAKAIEVKEESKVAIEHVLFLHNITDSRITEFENAPKWYGDR